MGRPPCCDKVGIKKGPWTPEEDIILVSYIQEHGPGNWRSVPTNTGLLRCSKSCRLRWTNYLRPGIKRGNFTPHEEGMIIHLQALLGNKWAAIASYLPQRTDNDIKNYWNTHLKKKIKKFQPGLDSQVASSSDNSTAYQFVCKSFSDRGSENSSIQEGSSLFSTSSHINSSLYASSAENISRLLEGWMRSSSTSSPINGKLQDQEEENHDEIKMDHEPSPVITSISSPLDCYKPKVDDAHQEREISGGNIISKEEFELSILSFDDHHDDHHNLNSLGWESNKSSCESTPQKDSDHSGNINDEKSHALLVDQKLMKLESGNISQQPPLSFLEKWLLDETAAGQVEEAMEIPPIF